MDYKIGDLVLMKHEGQAAIHRLLIKNDCLTTFKTEILAGNYLPYILPASVDNWSFSLYTWPNWKIENPNVLELLLYGLDETTAEQLIAQLYSPEAGVSSQA